MSAAALTRSTSPAALRGFTLIEAAVSIGIVLILAGMMAPLGVAVLDRQREAATKKGLELAFETLFGSRDRQVPNLRADFGFWPFGNVDDLGIMLGPQARVGAMRMNVPVWGLSDGSRFSWGHHGRDWLGPVQGGVPVDAWGRPIQLLVTPVLPGPPPPAGMPGPVPGDAVAVQVRSLGRSGIPGGGDNIQYPIVPLPLRTLDGQVILRMRKSLPTLIATGTVVVAIGGNQANTLDRLSLRVAFVNPAAGLPLNSITFQVPPGVMQVEISPTGPGDFQVLVIPIAMQPGEVRQLDIIL